MDKKITKIGTISLGLNTIDLNFGAILHNYAIVEFLKRQGYNAECIDYIPNFAVGFNAKFPFLYYIKKGKLKSFLRTMLIFRSFRERYNKFEDFKKRYMTISKNTYSEKTLSNTKLDYDVVIAESDVIWSVWFTGGDLEKAFFLDLPSMKHIKKIAYSPSLGDSKPEAGSNLENRFAECIKNIDFVSVRESYSIPYLESVSGRMDIAHVLDPVFLLDKLYYENMVIDNKRFTQNKYLLVYLPVGDNKKLIAQAEKFAQERNLEIIELSTKKIKRKHKVFFDVRVEEFISLIKNADIVFTNSFHAICFSLIFSVNFYAFSRRNGGKVLDICKQFNLENRLFEDDKFVEQEDIDWADINTMLKLKVDFSRQWLLNAINNNKNC